MFLAAFRSRSWTVPQAAALRIALGLQTCPDAPDPFLSRWPLSDPIPAAPILIAERTPT